MELPLPSFAAAEEVVDMRGAGLTQTYFYSFGKVRPKKKKKKKRSQPTDELSTSPATISS